MSRYDPSFGRYIRHQRLEKKLTQQEVAERVGTSTPYYNKIENAVLPPPGPETLDSLSKALGADRDELYAMAGKIPSDVIDALKGRPNLWRLIRQYAKEHRQ